MVLSIVVRLLSITVRSVESRISAKRKKPITCPFETQIMICPFFAMFKEHHKLTLEGGGGGWFRERRVHPVPLIVDLGFLYPKLSYLLSIIFLEETQDLVL